MAVRAEDFPRVPVGVWQGRSIYVVPDRPRMVLSKECVPGKVPWPPGFKEQMDAWMLEFFGTTNLLADMQVLQTDMRRLAGLPDGLFMNPRTYEALRKKMGW